MSNSLAAFLNLDKVRWTLHTSRLFLSPYFPTSKSSPSILSFSKGRLGVLKVDESRIMIKLTISIVFAHYFGWVSMLWNLIIY